jgi:hypothetical protein
MHDVKEQQPMNERSKQRDPDADRVRDDDQALTTPHPLREAEPHNEIPQAASAQDTFWGFVWLTPESMHMIRWHLSDRAIPRSFAMMDGFGVNPFRFVNEAFKHCKALAASGEGVDLLLASDIAGPSHNGHGPEAALQAWPASASPGRRRT